MDRKRNQRGSYIRRTHILCKALISYRQIFLVQTMADVFRQMRKGAYKVFGIRYMRRPESHGCMVMAVFAKVNIICYNIYVTQTQREAIDKQLENRPTPEKFAEGLEKLRKGVRDMIEGTFRMNHEDLQEELKRPLLASKRFNIEKKNP